MSIPERLFNISKAYINQVRDRIDAELTDAERELDATPGSPGSRSIDEGAFSADNDLATRTDPEAMMRRAEARIAAARRDLEGRNELAAREARLADTGSASQAPSVSSAAGPVGSVPIGKGSGNTGGSAAPAAAVNAESDPNFHDYRTLGVPVGGDLAQVQSEYEQLARRCDPRRFPDGSSEQKQAEQILQRINAAFEALRQRLDPMVNRFHKLELE